MENRIQEILSRDEDAVGELIELVTEYQAKAWDKGFDRGGRNTNRWGYLPGRSNKENKNPYRAQLEHHNGRRE